MEERTIKNKETKTAEFVLGIKEEKEEDIFVEDGISQEVDEAEYIFEGSLDVKVEEHDAFGDIKDCFSKSNVSNFSYHKETYAQSSDVCGKVKPHIQEDEPSSYSEKQYNCAECRYSSTSIDSIKNHYLALHCKIYKCNDCSHVSKTKSDLKKHILIVHNIERPFKCSECQYCCKKNSNLKIHIQTVHRREKTFKCGDCEYSCALRSILAKHVRAVHDKERPYKCVDCDNSFATQQHLRRHKMAVHEKEKPFKCFECEQSFGRSYLLANHIRRRVCSKKKALYELGSQNIGLETSPKQ